MLKRAESIITLENPVYSPHNINLYPNPVLNILNLKLNGIAEGIIYITEMSGRVIKSINYTGGNSMKIDCYNLKSGTYILRVNGFSYLFVKQP